MSEAVVYEVPASTDEPFWLEVALASGETHVIRLPPPSGQPPARPVKTMIVVPGTVLRVGGELVDVLQDHAEIHFRAVRVVEAE